MNTEELTGEEKIGFFSKIKRGLTGGVFEVSVEAGEVGQFPEVTIPDVVRVQVEPVVPVSSTEGEVYAHAPGMEPGLNFESEAENVEPLVITSDGISGPQVRRPRGYGGAVTPAASTKSPSDWLLPEGIALVDDLSPRDEASGAQSPEVSLSTGSLSEPRTLTMANNLKDSLNKLMELDGATAVALVDGNSGMAMGTAGGGPLNLEVAAAGNSEVVRAKLKTMKALNLTENIEDILISLNTQYHLIRPLAKAPEVFIYLVLSRSNSNLAMARHKLASIEKELEI